MILAPHDAALFYRAWGALLTWVNAQRHIVPAFPPPTPERPIGPTSAMPIRKVLWADDQLREQFLVEHAAQRPSAELDLIASWKHRVSGNFVLLKHLQKHSVFMSEEVFGVLGIYTPFAEMFPRIPMFVQAVLIPFRNVIITDGLLESPPMQLSFGAGARRMFQDQYRRAHAASLIRTTLAPATTPRAPLPRARPSAPAKTTAPSSAPGLRAQPRAPAKPAAAPSASAERPDHRLRGSWRITTTEIWDGDALDLIEPAFLRFDGRPGVLRMIAIRAELDCRYGARDGKPLVEFTFEGDDDGHPCHGRGWATLDPDGLLRGRLHIHHGDDSGFIAERDAIPTSARSIRKRPPAARRGT